MRRHGNMAFAVVFFVIGILMFVFTKDFAYNGLMDFGAGFWPRIIVYLCGIPGASACQTADGHYLQLRRFEKCLMLLPFPSLLVSF